MHRRQPELACLPTCSSSSSSSEGQEEETGTSGPGYGSSTRSSPAKRDSQGRLIGVDTLIQVGSDWLREQEPSVKQHGRATAHSGCVQQPAGTIPYGLLPPFLHALMVCCWLSGFHNTQHLPAHSAQVASAHLDNLVERVQARHAGTSPVGERSRAWRITAPTLHSEKSLISAALDKSGLVAAAGQVGASARCSAPVGREEGGGGGGGIMLCRCPCWHASCSTAEVSLMSTACHIQSIQAHPLVLCLQGCVGLCNLGNTCFANSILQVRSCPQAQLPSR